MSAEPASVDLNNVRLPRVSARYGILPSLLPMVRRRGRFPRANLDDDRFDNINTSERASQVGMTNDATNCQRSDLIQDTINRGRER